MDSTLTQLRTEFFGLIFGNTEGYVCLATGTKEDPRRTFKQHFFHWPTQEEAMSDFIDTVASDKNVWFCVNILENPERRKEQCLPADLVWADLDTCNPSEVSPTPTAVINSSPNRYQAIWKMEQDVVPEVAEDYSRRIAYKYNKNGADVSGWDLTQLLRVPFTTNFKYAEEPMVTVYPEVGEAIALQEFEDIPAPERARDDLSGAPDMPEISELDDADKIIYKYQSYLPRAFYDLFEIEPDTGADWSTRMWKLNQMCYEAGMEPEEVFSICIKAKCNKYERDRRPIRYLWNEIVKGNKVQNKIADVAGNWEPLLFPELVQPEEWTTDTFMDMYRSWAIVATDAVEVYHDLAATILLSATLASHVKLETSYGDMIPNLWGLVLGESTLTRKTTAMSMVMSILNEVDPEAIVATDGSAEGILSSLAARSGRVSVYYKDEVSGFFDSINRKDYLAGIPEMFTQLYDSGPPIKRILKKEEIIVHDPIFVFFGGGIRDKTYSLLNDSYILSGFLPRFLIVNGDNDLSRLRRTGPANSTGIAEREKIINFLRDLQELYTVQATMRIGGQIVDLTDTKKRPRKTAILTPDAWQKYGDFEEKLVKVASDSYYSSLALPTFERLSRSLLKLSVLLAASRQEPDGGSFPVEVQDVINSARFIQQWGRHSVDLIMNVGKPQMLRLVEKVRVQIETRPGIQRSELLRMNHMSSREMNEVVATLIDRGEITKKSNGRREQFWAIH